jgi:hypothetical protein
MAETVRLLLLARTGTSAAPIRELERLCAEALRLPGIAGARHAFIEEGTLYGGVDETGINRIVQSHLLNGEPVADLAYAPTGAKQKLRP